MIERLVVKNFGPIKDANLDIRRYTLFIGKQASGKSTIAKLLAIFRSAAFILEGQDAKPNYSRFFQLYGIDNYFSETPLRSTYLEYTNLDYKIGFDKQSGWKITKEESYQERISSIDERLRLVIENYIKKQGTTDEPSKDLFNSIYDANKILYFEGLITSKQAYIPANRTLYSLIDENAFSLGNLPIPLFLREFGKEFEIAKSTIKNHYIDFLNVKYSYEGSKNRIYYSDTESLLLSESASGLQAIVPMILAIENLKKVNSAFIVEEPELNLFPTTQKQVINFLVRCSNEVVKNDMVITTHSPYVLSALNLLLLAYITAKEKPDQLNAVRDLVDPSLWIDPNEFNAFYFADRQVKEIFDRNVNIISGNELDDVSQDLEGVFEELMDLYKESA